MLMNMKPYKAGILLVIFLVILNCTLVFADDGNGYDEKIDDKLEQQHEDLKDSMGEFGDYSDGFDSMVDKLRTNRNKDYDSFSMDDFKKRSSNFLFTTSLESRRLSVPIYVITIILNIILMSIFGGKNLKKRKYYIIGCIVYTVLFLLFLNIPLIIIYFQQTPIGEILNKDTVSKNLYMFIEFMRANCVFYGLLLISYGIVNKILGRNDVARGTNGGYVIKVAIITVLVLLILPPFMAYVI